MRIAIPTHPESETVERFGHDFPILLVELIDGAAPISSVQPPVSGCCGSLARSIEGTDLLICAGLGESAARHLEALGVDIAVVPTGLGINAAIEHLGQRGWTSREAPAISPDTHGGCGGHSHGAHEGDDHGHGHGGCGGRGACGGHSHDAGHESEAHGHGHGSCGGHGHGHS